jgi:hypothetical protein
MGFAFMPVAIGALLAGFLADFITNQYLTSNPSMMWYVTAGVGLCSTALMIMYNFIFGRLAIKAV